MTGARARAGLLRACHTERSHSAARTTIHPPLRHQGSASPPCWPPGRAPAARPRRASGRARARAYQCLRSNESKMRICDTSLAMCFLRSSSQRCASSAQSAEQERGGVRGWGRGGSGYLREAWPCAGCGTGGQGEQPPSWGRWRQPARHSHSALTGDWRRVRSHDTSGPSAARVVMYAVQLQGRAGWGGGGRRLARAVSGGLKRLGAVRRSHAVWACTPRHAAPAHATHPSAAAMHATMGHVSLGDV